ncbi:GNAT family N-acetyltransferase [Noviherbaspirillum agri]
MFSIREAQFPADGPELKAVIREYVAWLDMDLSYRGFAQEMAEFDARFTLPSGMFFIARAGTDIAGCAGLLRNSGAVAEVKRLYVRPPYRGHALGERLIGCVIAKARSLGFSRLILDAVPQTVVAQALYRALGFVETDPYYADPVPGTKFFALPLMSTPGYEAGQAVG